MDPRGRKKGRGERKKGENGRNRRRKGRGKSMHLRARATLNILMAQCHRQCYRGGSVHTHPANRNPFFSRLQFNTQIGSCDNAMVPRKQPLSLPFFWGHTPNARNRVKVLQKWEISKGDRSGVRVYVDRPWFVFWRCAFVSWCFGKVNGETKKWKLHWCATASPVHGFFILHLTT